MSYRLYSFSSHLYKAFQFGRFWFKYYLWLNYYKMQQIIKDKIHELKGLCETYDVKTLYVFGSASTDNFNKASDIDILISFKDISIDKYTDNYFELHYKLEELFSRKIDLLTENSLSNPYLIESIEETKQLLYAA